LSKAARSRNQAKISSFAIDPPGTGGHPPNGMPPESGMVRVKVEKLSDENESSELRSPGATEPPADVGIDRSSPPDAKRGPRSDLETDLIFSIIRLSVALSAAGLMAVVALVVLSLVPAASGPATAGIAAVVAIATGTTSMVAMFVRSNRLRSRRDRKRQGQSRQRQEDDGR
jgi:hypothetical protein